jgi:hypothetical protein
LRMRSLHSRRGLMHSSLLVENVWKLSMAWGPAHCAMRFDADSANSLRCAK